MGPRRCVTPGIPAVLALACALAGCGGGAPAPEVTAATSVPATPATPAPPATPPTPPTTVAAAPTTAPTTAPTRGGARTPPANGATPAPAWLGTRVLPTAANGIAFPQRTPRALFPRRIVTVDELPPPAGGRFHATVARVPVRVADRSTWSAGCPVTLDDLRYVTVSFRGFDGRAHTGELLVNRSATTALVTVFRKLFRAGFPIEAMRITSAEDLSAPPTGDGNTTAAFACRPVVGQKAVWSQHAYGLAVDVDPFQNPRTSGSSVIPELATAYRDRGLGLPGMITRGGVVVRAFSSVGWGWGGNFSSTKDYMHFSANGR